MRAVVHTENDVVIEAQEGGGQRIVTTFPADRIEFDDGVTLRVDRNIAELVLSGKINPRSLRTP